MAPERNTEQERPLSARSLIASLLLRSQPKGMRASRLVQWCELFEIAEGTARVALSRMVDRGELRAADGMYELAGRVGTRRVAQDWSIEPALEPWDGTWRFGLVAGGPRDAGARVALRDAMRSLRYAELREGVWTRPANLPHASAPNEWWQIADTQCTWWDARPDDDSKALAAALFDGAGWNRRAIELERRLRAATITLVDPGGERLADAFVAGAAAIAHLRADPLLPPELSDDRAGTRLRAAYQAYERAFSRALQQWFRQQ